VDAAEAIPSLRSWLQARGIAVHRLETIVPSLEDVFVSLVTREVGA